MQQSRERSTGRGRSTSASPVRLGGLCLLLLPNAASVRDGPGTTTVFFTADSDIYGLSANNALSVSAPVKRHLLEIP